MSLVQVCDNCGAKIEIEDSNALEPVTDTLPTSDENRENHVLCEQCAHDQESVTM